MLTLHPELFNLLLAGFATLLIGLGLVVLLAIRRRGSPSSMALSSPIEPSDRPATTVPVVSCAAASQEPVPVAEQAHGPPWTAVGPGGRPGKRTHPLYKKVATINGQVNGLSPSELKQRAEQLALSIRGEDAIVSKRLKTYLRREAILGDPTAPGDLVSLVQSNPYGLDYVCVLDFEATCEAQNPPDYIHEIIEFPVLILNLKTLEIEDEFKSYCRPWVNPMLTDFCKRLTGIRQDQVSSAPSFSKVFERFSEWLETKELGTKYKFAIATDCPWDIKECLFPQCVLASVPFPKFATKWIDVRKLFGSFYQVKSGNLSNMLQSLGMRFEGREHCGIDDTRNITRILVQMIKDGCVLKYNRFMPEDALRQFAVKGKR